MRDIIIPVESTDGLRRDDWIFSVRDNYNGVQIDVRFYRYEIYTRPSRRHKFKPHRLWSAEPLRRGSNYDYYFTRIEERPEVPADIAAALQHRLNGVWNIQLSPTVGQ